MTTDTDTETYNYAVTFTTEARFWAIVPATSPEEAEEKVENFDPSVNWDRIQIDDFGYDSLVVDGDTERY